MTEETKDPRRYKNGNIGYVFEHGLFINERRLYLGSANSNDEGREGGIDSRTAEKFVKGLLLLVADKKRVDEPITVVLNSIGGEVEHGWAIYDAIRAAPSQVYVEVLGQAISMGAVILQAADRRLMHPNAIIMVHDGDFSDADSSKSMRSAINWANHRDYELKKISNLLAQRTKKDASYWQEVQHDTVYTAKQALELGLIDEIIEPKKKLPVPQSRDSLINPPELKLA